MNSEQIKKLGIPTGPGSYQFLDKTGKIIYIGKAANLKNRVSSYWRASAGLTGAKRSMLGKIAKIKWVETESEIEALLLEANLIKKHQPKYNVDLKDDKRRLYIKITADEFPRVLLTREIGKEGRYYGPFTSATAVKETIKIIRQVWPYGGFLTMPENKMSLIKAARYPELYGAPSDKTEYKKIIAEIEAFLEGRRKEIEKNLQSSIRNLQSDFEKTGNEEIARKISGLKYRLLNLKNVLAHANVLSVHDKYAADVVELAKILGLPKTPKRIEGYDISNLFEQEAVGSMVVFAEGEPDKSQYRKFKIKSSKSGGDTAMLKEILERRFNNDWPLPDLIIIDGGKGQLNAALSVLKKLKLSLPALAVSKGEGLRSSRAPDKIFFPFAKQALVLPLASPALHIIKRVRDEAHRFAIEFHRQKRSKKFFGK